MEARAGDERILLVTHYGFLHFFLGLALFGDAFGPEHLIPLWYAGHANTGISVFERRNRRMDGMDFAGWHLTDLERPGAPVISALVNVNCGIKGRVRGAVAGPRGRGGEPVSSRQSTPIPRACREMSSSVH